MADNKNPEALQYISVHWLDAGFCTQRLTEDEIKQLKLGEVYTSGYLVRKDEDVTVLAQNYWADKKQFEYFMIIPSSMIIETQPKDSD